MAGNDDSAQQPDNIEQVERLLKINLPLPRVWLLIVAVASLLSLFEISRTAEGGVVATFRFTSITAILVALVWLPVLLRVLALTGGRLKTPAGEVSTGGVLEILRSLDPGMKQVVFPTMISALEVDESKVAGPQQPGVQQLRQDLERQLVALPAPRLNDQQLQQQLDEFARDYEALRQRLPSGSERTIKMNEIVTRVRTLGQQLGFTSDQVREIFGRGSEGDRIVALGILRAKPQLAPFDLIIEAIGHSKSAFEQYHALRVAQAILPRLTGEEKQTLAKVLLQERQPGGTITPSNPNRWARSTQILDAIGWGADAPATKAATR